MGLETGCSGVRAYETCVVWCSPGYSLLAPTTTETYDCLPTMDYVPVKKDADGNYVTENAPACSYSELTPQARCYSNNNCFYLWLGKFRYTNVWCISK